MKKLLCILLFVPFTFLGQSIISIEQDVPLELQAGWNMFGYSCYESQEVIAAFEPVVGKIIIVKDNSGAVYMPEFGFNGIGNLECNLGYQIKTTEAIIDFQFCSILVPLVDGCTDETADNYNPQALSSSNCIYSGCMDNTAGNYNPMANQDDNSCIPAEACPYPEYLEYDSTATSFNASLCNILAVYGCMDGLALNYNSEANVNEGCEHIYGCMDGMAENYNEQATSDDNSCIISGCTDTQAWNFNSYANTDDGSCLIGGCVFELAENYNANAGINDGSCIVFGCILDDYPNYNLWATVDDGSCDMSSTDVFGCTDSTGYNYNPLATINNGDCVMLHPGEQVHGGIVFYVDETGQHGLVAAMEDIEGTYEWGCYLQFVEGADGFSIGTGYQNTMDIVNQGCATNDGGITAAQAALDAEINGYSDWYLPSKDELSEMYITIGAGALNDNVGGFADAIYWSSSENSGGCCASYVYLSSGSAGDIVKFRTFRVRVIRSF